MVTQQYCIIDFSWIGFQCNLLSHFTFTYCHVYYVYLHTEIIKLQLGIKGSFSFLFFSFFSFSFSSSSSFFKVPKFVYTSCLHCEAGFFFEDKLLAAICLCAQSAFDESIYCKHAKSAFHLVANSCCCRFVWPRDLCYVRYWRRNDDGSYGNFSCGLACNFHLLFRRTYQIFFL